MSERIDRCVIQLKKYDFDAVHISAPCNNLSDIFSGNSAGLTPQQIKSATRPKEIMIAAVHLNSDPTVREKLKNLARYQNDDT